MYVIHEVEFFLLMLITDWNDMKDSSDIYLVHMLNNV